MQRKSAHFMRVCSSNLGQASLVCTLGFHVCNVATEVAELLNSGVKCHNTLRRWRVRRHLGCPIVSPVRQI